MDTATKTGLGPVKCASKKLVHKIAEAAGGEFIGNKIAEKIVSPKSVPQPNARNIEEVVIPPEQKKRNTQQFKSSIIKWNTTKYLNC